MTLKLRFTSEEISDGKKNLKQVLIDGRETATGFGEYIDFLTPVIAPQHPNAEICSLWFSTATTMAGLQFLFSRRFRTVYQMCLAHLRTGHARTLTKFTTKHA